MTGTALKLNRSHGVLLLIICLGALLRFFYLGHQSLWYDEALSLAIANRLSLAAILTNQGESSHPPLYYLLLRLATNWVGVTDFTARLPSAWAGILTIPLLYRVGRQIAGQRAGLWSAFFAAVFPFQVYYAQEARMYTLLAMLTSFSLLFFLKAIRHNRWQHWLFFGLTLALGVYTHYFTFFVLLAYHLFLLLYWRRYLTIWPAILLTDLLLILIFVPQLMNFLGQSQEVFTNYWLGSPSPLALFTTIYFFVVSFTMLPQWTFVGLFMVLSWLALGIFELTWRTKKLATLRRRLVLLCLGVFTPLLTVLVISQFKPIFLERTLIICTPFLMVLLAWSVANTHRRSPLPYLAGILGILLMVSLVRFYFEPSVQKPPLRQAAAFINAQFEPGDMVLHTSVGSFVPFLFYPMPDAPYLLWGDPDPRKTKSAFEQFGGKIITRDQLSGRRRVWLVVELDHSVDYQLSQVAWFDATYPLIEEKNINGIFTRLYEISEK